MSSFSVIVDCVYVALSNGGIVNEGRCITGSGSGMWWHFHGS